MNPSPLGSDTGVELQIPTGDAAKSMTESSEESARQTNSRLGWPLTIATGFALVLLSFSIWAFWTIAFDPKGIDFVSFWAAGRMVISGHPAAAYDIAAHRGLELTVAGDTGLMPFPYPPPFLLILTPFAVGSFAVAFMCWDVITGTLYALAAKRVAPLPYVLANPPVLTACMIGQSSLLICAVMIFGLMSVSTSPFVAGAVLGLSIIKPQLALLLPVAMIAGRRWRVIMGAVTSSVIVSLLALLILGADTYRGFFAIIPQYVGYLRDARWQWSQIASVFAFLRYFGASASVALAVQGFVALGAAATVALAWARDWENKIPILAAATLLTSAYLFTYDAVLLILPAGVLIAQCRFRSLLILWVLAALPVLQAYGLYYGPNTVPFAAILSVGLLAAPRLKRQMPSTPIEETTPSLT